MSNLMKRPLKIILIIFILVSTYNILWAQALKQTEAVKEFIVPENYGSIRDSHFVGNEKGIIIHIQDLHCNYDAQLSIYNIINELIDRYGLNLVTVEGSVGRLDTPYAKNPEKDIKEMVGKYFLKTGEINGAAFCYLMRDGNFTFYGADDRTKYLDNVTAYKVSLDTKAINRKYYDNMKSILEQFKSKVYSPELKGLDSKIEAYKADRLEFAQYISYLDGLIAKLGLAKGDYKNFSILTDVLKKEAEINFTEVDTQRSEYMEKLSKELDKASLSDLLDKSLHFKAAKISALEFYTYLKELSENKKVSPVSDYKELSKYIDYIRLYSTIENIALFKEIEAIEKALKDKLFTSDIQRKVDAFSHNLDILNGLFQLKLTKDTLQYYRDHRKEFATSYLINFISENAPKYGIRYKLDPSFREIDRQLPSLERFYDLAEERDNILVENTINKMKEQKAKLAVLVSGGFHTDGITRLLKEKELSYVVITPKVNKLDENNPYTSVLLGEKNASDNFYEMVMESRKK